MSDIVWLWSIVVGHRPDLQATAGAVTIGIVGPAGLVVPLCCHTGNEEEENECEDDETHTSGYEIYTNKYLAQSVDSCGLCTSPGLFIVVCIVAGPSTAAYGVYGAR
jgi:hypothetical protein